MKLPVIHMSKDYNKFILADGQRNSTQAHVDKLVKEIKTQVLFEPKLTTFQYKPAICREILNKKGKVIKYKVIDGGHRILAAEKTDTPFFYSLVNRKDTRSDQELMLTFNAKAKPQSLESQLLTKASTGHKPSLDILSLHKELLDHFGTAPSVSTIAMLSIGFGDNGNAKTEFEDKKGNITLRHLKKCTDFLYDIGNLKLNFQELDKIPSKLNFHHVIWKVCLEMAKNYPSEWATFKTKRTKYPLKFKKNCDLKHFLRSKILKLTI